MNEEFERNSDGANDSYFSVVSRHLRWKSLTGVYRLTLVRTSSPSPARRCCWWSCGGVVSDKRDEDDAPSAFGNNARAGFVADEGEQYTMKTYRGIVKGHRVVGEDKLDVEDGTEVWVLVKSAQQSVTLAGIKERRWIPD